jgi:creatinine amidohydrolase
MENCPWTRLPGITMPDLKKPLMSISRFQQLDPLAKKQLLGDGNYGGFYQRADEEMLAIWATAIAETRQVILQDWA